MAGEINFFSNKKGDGLTGGNRNIILKIKKLLFHSIHRGNMRLSHGTFVCDELRHTF